MPHRFARPSLMPAPANTGSRVTSKGMRCSRIPRATILLTAPDSDMPRAFRTAIARSLIPEPISMLMLAVFAISPSRLSPGCLPAWFPMIAVGRSPSASRPLHSAPRPSAQICEEESHRNPSF